MKAVVFKEVGKIELEDVPEPMLEKDTDAIVRIRTSTVFVRTPGIRGFR